MGQCLAKIRTRVLYRVRSVIVYNCWAGVDAEKVGVDAANELLRNIDDGGCVDEFLQDQV